MTCAEISELLTEFMLEELPSDLMEKVNEHVQGCATCRSELLALRQINSELRAMACEIEPPEYLSNQLEQMLVAEIATPAKSRKLWQPKIIMQIAATFLIAVIGWGVWYSPNDESSTAVVLDQREQSAQQKQKQPSQESKTEKETETVVQDAQLLQQQTGTEPVPQIVEPSPRSVETALEPKTEPVTQELAIAQDDMETAEILRNNLVDQEELVNQGDQAPKQSVTMAKTEIIAIDTVHKINIKLINNNQKEQALTPADNMETIAMIVEGINNVLPLSSMKRGVVNDENEITHIISIQLETGESYQLNYCQAENICFAEGINDGKLVQPGDSLSLALESVIEFDQMLTN